MKWDFATFDESQWVRVLEWLARDGFICYNFEHHGLVFRGKFPGYRVEISEARIDYAYYNECDPVYMGHTGRYIRDIEADHPGLVIKPFETGAGDLVILESRLVYSGPPDLEMLKWATARYKDRKAYEPWEWMK